MRPDLIDLRSDTVTLPTEAMRAAMANAPVGDDVYGEDPSVNELERKAAALLGKESALFVSSGTMGNQLAVLSQTTPGDEIICERSAHVFLNEAGALARLGGVQAATLTGVRGVMPLGDVAAAVRGDNIHYPRTALLCLENTHNAHGGVALPQSYLQELYAFAQARGLRVHMDGARLFNAQVALGVDVREIAACADTVTFCLSKGLCAPVGSLLCGPGETIAQARKFRKMMGGGMRQAGILAVAGIVAIEQMIGRLAEDHENARLFAQLIRELPGVSVGEVQTNIVYFDVSADAETLAAKLRVAGVLISPVGPGSLRAVTHWGIASEDVRAAAAALGQVLTL